MLPKSRCLRIGGTFLKDWRFIIILILIIGIIFRVYDLHSSFEGHTSHNEAYYSMEARNIEKYGPFVLRSAIGEDYHFPPLFPWIVHLSFRFLGESEGTARLVPITFGVSTLVFMFLLGSILFDKRFGLLMAFMLAVNPMHAYISHAVQLEVPMLFFMTASLYFFILWMRNGKNRYFWLAGAMSSLGLFTKQTSIIVLLPILFLLIRKKGWLSSLRNYKVWLFLLLSLIPSLLWFLYGLRMAGSQAWSFAFESVQTSWLFKPEFYSKEYSLLIERWGPIYFTLFLIGLASSLFFKDLKDQIMLLWLLGGTGYLLFFARLTYIHDYYLLTIIIPATFFAVKPLEALSAKNKYSCLLLVILIVLSSGVHTRNLYEIRSPGLKEAGLYLNARTKPDERIICSFPQVAYYAQREVVTLEEIQNITDFKNILERQKIRYVVDIPTLQLPFFERNPEILRYLAENFTSEEEFGVVKIYFKE